MIKIYTAEELYNNYRLENESDFDLRGRILLKQHLYLHGYNRDSFSKVSYDDKKEIITVWLINPIEYVEIECEIEE